MFPRARTFPLIAVLALVAILPTAAHAAKRLKPPAGLGFYQPPSPMPAGKHGAVIWSRTITGQAALAGGARTTLVLYRSVAAGGEPIAVSGTFTVPKGKAPKGGWPVVSWAHGTTGGADVCAPSRDSVSNPAHAYNAYVYPVLQAWLKKGYAIARTDYEGLGTPGPHPYLIGRSEGRGVIDIVRAARQVDPRIGKRWIAAGHSQGGHAALWAAADGPKWAPELKLAGVDAFAPASHIATALHAAKALTSPSPISGLGALIATGSAAFSSEVNLQTLLSDKAFALVPQVEEKCLPQLSQPDSWGALAPAEILRDGVDTTALDNVLNANDPGKLKIDVPVLIQQGDADTTVYKAFTDGLDTDLKAAGDKVDYRIYPGIDHAGIVNAGLKDATAFFKKRLK